MCEESRQYVIAVSGGVDSVVLLDALVHNRLHELTNHESRITNHELIVAHFDHGIRPDSAEDAEWVRALAAGYGLEYVSERVELGLGASESAARQMRYNFLRQTCKKHNALLITAHHQDDVIETIIINLIRGTGWRGLAPMAVKISDLRSQIIDSQSPTILRPLIGVSKAQILEYAKKYQLQWREDSTNANEKYLRNYVRRSLLPAVHAKNPAAKQQLLELNANVVGLRYEIATELQKIIAYYQLSTINYQLPRYFLIMIPAMVAQEILYHIIAELVPDWHPERRAILGMLHFVKTGLPRKTYQLHRSLEVSLTEGQVWFKKVP